MVLYDSCIFCMHTVNCSLEHYREPSPSRTPPCSRRYTLAPSPASSTGRNTQLPERSPASSSSGDTVIRDGHRTTSNVSPNWRAHSDFESIPADHTPDPFEDEPDSMMIGSPSSLGTCGTPTPPSRGAWFPPGDDASPSSPTPAKRDLNYTTLAIHRSAKMPLRRTLIYAVQECEVEKDLEYVDDDAALAEGLQHSLDSGGTPVESVNRIVIDQDVYEDYRYFGDLRAKGAVTPEYLPHDMADEEGASPSAIDQLIFGNRSRDKGKGKMTCHERSYPNPDPERSPPSVYGRSRPLPELPRRTSTSEDWHLEMMLEQPTRHANLSEYARSELEPRKQPWPETWDELMPKTRIVNEWLASELDTSEVMGKEREVEGALKEVGREDVLTLLASLEIDVKGHFTLQPTTNEADNQTILGTGLEYSEPEVVRVSVLEREMTRLGEVLRKRARSASLQSEAPIPDPFEITSVSSPSLSDAETLVADTFAGTADFLVATLDAATSTLDAAASTHPQEAGSDTPIPDAFEITPDTTGTIFNTAVLNPDTALTIPYIPPNTVDEEAISWAEAPESAYPTVNSQPVQEGIFAGFEQAHVRWLLSSTNMRLKELQTKRKLRDESASKLNPYKLVIYHGKGKGREGT